MTQSTGRQAASATPKAELQSSHVGGTAMQRIDEARLETDVVYRFDYVSGFIGFSQEDIDAIHAAARLLSPLLPDLVDVVYDQLFAYDCTKRHFVPRQSGYDGPVPESLDILSTDHEMIQFRKQHLWWYLSSLITRPFDEKMVMSLDFVGQIHTSKAGSQELDVPLVQMNSLLGFVSNALLGTIFRLGLDSATEQAAVLAFSKLFWIQNDLITRHYHTPAVTA
jgi:hypothetical protein